MAPRAHARLRIHPVLDVDVFRRMADMSSDAFYLNDEGGRFLYVNDRATAMVGYTRNELLRMTVSDLNPEFPPDRFEEFVANMGPGLLPPFETVSRRKDGTLVPIELSVARFELNGKPYMFGTVRDISERKQLEEARRGFARRILQTLEAERQRVARELHDDVGQAIATVGVLLHSMEQQDAIREDGRTSLAAMHATLAQISESVARIVRDHHPADLVGLGLEDALRSHALQFTQRHSLALHLTTVPMAGLLSQEHELHVYRIVQEALSNVARHAAARRVTVRISRRGPRLTITVRDNGRGFNPARADVSGFGLVTMRERAALMDATLTVQSAPRRGTEVRLVLERGAPARPRPRRRAATSGRVEARKPRRGGLTLV